MAKYLENLKNELNLDYRRDNNDNTLFGVVNGYEVSIYASQFSNEGIVTYINFYASNALKEEIIYLLVNFEGSSFAKGYITKYGVRFALNGWTYNSAAKKLIKKINYILGILKERNVLGANYSPFTGVELVEKTVLGIGEGYVTLEKEMADQIRADFDKQKEEHKAKPNNYLRGFIGSLVGALIGALAFLVLFFIGFISAWIGVLSVFLAALLYKKFGGKETIITYIVSGIISLAVIMVTIVLISNFYISSYLQSEEINLTVQEAISTYEEIREVYYGNIISTAIYTTLGVVLQVIFAGRKLLRKDSMVR